MNSNSVLLAGGYGVVGAQVARLIRARHPDWRILIGGRSPQKAEPLARELGNAEAVFLDTTQPAPLQDLQPNAIIQLVNDPRNTLILDAARRGIPYVDITRWTENFRAAYDLLGEMTLRAPVILSSAWMAGIAIWSALYAAQKLAQVESVEIGIQYSLKDKAGPNSVEYLDRLHLPFEVTRGGKTALAHGLSAPRKFNFLHGKPLTAYLFDIPDQFTLPRALHAKTVLGRLTFDDGFSIHLLSFLVRSGIWRLISGERFTPLRRSLMYNPGQGGEHQISTEMTGLDGNRQPKKFTVQIADSQGQTHLTALGAVASFERVIGADGAPAPRPGVYSPESASPQLEAVFSLLKDNGVQVKVIENE